MITIRLAGLNIGIDNQYDFTDRVRDWIVQAEPEFTVRVSPEELELEDDGRGMSPEYLEFICAYRHIAERLPAYDAFVFHGVAIAVDGRAYLFTAPSGTGKTTHGMLWCYALAEKKPWFLSGDKPILRRTPEGFLACGTPWRGKENFGVNAELPIQGICLLRRGEKNFIRPAETNELVLFLARQIYMPRDPAQMDKLLTLVDECCRTVPIWALYCTLNLKAAVFAYRAMRPREPGERREDGSD